MENNDNLSDFFNKKLNEFGDSDSTWDKPDADVREAVLAKITPPVVPTFSYVKLAWVGGIAASLLLVGGYIYWLKSGVDDLKLELKQERERVEVLEQEIADLSQKQSTEIAKLELKNDELVALNELAFEEKKELESVVSEKDREIFVLREVHPSAPSKGGDFSLREKLSSNTFPSLENRRDEEKRPEILTSNSTLTKTQTRPKLEGAIQTENAANLEIKQEKTATIFTKNIPSISPKEILNPTMQLANTSAFVSTNYSYRERNKFEIGGIYALQGMTVPTMRRFDKQGFAGNNLRAKKHFTSFNGLAVGYEVKPNWWIRGGVQVGKSKVGQEGEKFILRYDDSDEYTEMGERINDFRLTSSNPYAETNNELRVSIPEDELENGDLFEMYLSDYQKIIHFKVPVSAEYHYGEGRLKWVLRGGVQLNRVVFGDYRLKAIVRSSMQDLYNRDAEIPAERFSSKHFMGASVGIGMDYKFSEKIHARIGYNYQYDWIKPRIRSSNSAMVGTAFSLGLNYRIEV